MQYKTLAAVALVLLCVFSAARLEVSAKKDKRFDSIIIMGTEPFDAGDIETSRIERKKKRNAKKAAEEALRLANEQRFKPAYKELARVFSKVEVLDSYCDRIIVSQFHRVGGVGLSKIFKGESEEYLVGNTRERLVLKRCMRQSGKWKISRKPQNRPIQHRWVTSRSQIVYTPDDERLEISSINSRGNNFETITDFVFGEARELENLHSDFRLAQKYIYRFGYEINMRLSNEDITVLEKISESLMFKLTMPLHYKCKCS